MELGELRQRFVLISGEPYHEVMEGAEVWITPVTEVLHKLGCAGDVMCQEVQGNLVVVFDFTHVSW